jgi:hypothetical protein
MGTFVGKVPSDVLAEAGDRPVERTKSVLQVRVALPNCQASVRLEVHRLGHEIMRRPCGLDACFTVP